MATVDILKVAIQHVPGNIPRSVDGVPLRLTYIYKIFKTLSHGSHDEDLEIQEVGEYVRVPQSSLPSFSFNPVRWG